MSRLKAKFNEEIIDDLKKTLELSNVMEVPKLKKVVLNMGVGEATENRSAVENARKELEQISGQHALITKAKKSISNFHLRKGYPIGTKTTLRGEKMYEFVDRLVSVVIPRIRDFDGLSRNGFDGHGNYTLGIKEQTVFPEIEYDKIDKVRGLNITFVTSAENDEKGFALLSALGMPFKKK
ncbi:MAG: 50S ribosomal protein L5 [Candidatus Cloacimonetes bacterium]|nr:50S ribosomal protein L5 [Candidatus Cloacimonadota bacterium]MBS3766926.1 50S ribosomal protein L5 [Candidatus Cloacimonadota bacterium]